jgi:hypothetical protein
MPIIRHLILCFILLLPLLTASQSYKDHHKKYAGKFNYVNIGDEEVVRTWYHYVVTRTLDGYSRLRTFYPETGQITLLATYKGSDLKVLSGHFRSWYDDGRLVTSGQYMNGLKTGRWIEHDSEGEYQDDHRHGVWISKGYPNTVDSGAYSTGKKDGVWLERDSLGRRLWMRSYSNDLLHGASVRYDHEEGTEIHQTYENGVLTNGEASEVSVEKMPLFGDCGSIADEVKRTRCGDTELMRFLSKTIKDPRHASDLNISGAALVSFAIDKDGSVTDLKVLNGVCASIEAECRRVIGLMPNWTPGYQRGEPVKVQYNLPIRFTLR